MLKRLAIVGFLVIGLCGAWSQVPGNGSGQHDKAQDKQETANPSKPVVTVDSQHGANNQEQAAKKPAKYPWGELLAPTNIPNWFLVVVGAVTGWFVYKTLRAIKRQADIMETGAKDARQSNADATKIALATAKAAQKSADAANAQIQMLKDRERGRLRIEFGKLDFINDPGDDGYQLHFNVFLDGATQVYITKASCFSAIHETGDVSKDSQWYGDMGLPITVTPEKRTIEGSVLVWTNEKPWAEPMIDPPDKASVALVLADKLHVFVRGAILYRDIFGGLWEVRFNHRWQYYHDPFTYDGMDMSGGYWVSVGDNGEYETEDEEFLYPN